MTKLVEVKQQSKDRIEKLKLMIEQKKEQIRVKEQRESEIQNNLKKVDRFATEKLSEGKYYQEVFKAFKGKLIED